jgi:hypothetical protein
MTARFGLLSLVLVALLSCKASKPQKKEREQTAAESSSKPVDRLSQDEVAPGGSEVFGFEVPRQMRIEHHFTDAVHLVGDVTPEALANYVRTRVSVQHVEIGAARTIFPNARIKAGKPERLYQLEVLPDRLATKLIIRDITPPPVVEGLSDAERWRRAGLTPDGRPINPKALE